MAKAIKISLLEQPLIEHTIDSSPYYEESQNKNEALINDALKTDFERILSKYPSEHKKSAIIPILTLCQVHNGGYLTESIIQEVAQYLQIEAIKIFEVATFYSLFNHQPVNKFQLRVCQGVSCLLSGYKEVLQAIMQRIETNQKNNLNHELFSIKKVECLGACGKAPIMMIGDQYHENLTPSSAVELIDSLSNNSKLPNSE